MGMLKIIVLYFGLVGFVLCGGMPEVLESEEKAIMEDSDAVFEAIFIEDNWQWYKGEKEVARDEIVGDDIKGVHCLITIKLLVIKSIKGGLDKHSIHTIKFKENFGSLCPHILDYGNFRYKQIYYLKKGEAKASYRYRTVRERRSMSSIAKNELLLGASGVRMGRIIRIEGAVEEEVGNDPFARELGRISVTHVNSKKKSCRFSVFELSVDCVSDGGKLPKSGEKFKLRGYESIVVSPFEADEDVAPEEKEYPQFFGFGIYDIRFIITEVLPVDEK